MAGTQLRERCRWRTNVTEANIICHQLFFSPKQVVDKSQKNYFLYQFHIQKPRKECQPIREHDMCVDFGNNPELGFRKPGGSRKGEWLKVRSLNGTSLNLIALVIICLQKNSTIFFKFIIQFRKKQF